MRQLSSLALLSASLLLAACGKPAAQQPAVEQPAAQQSAVEAAPAAQPAAQPAASPVSTIADDLTAKLDAAKAEVAKYQAQVEGFLKDKAGLETKLSEAMQAFEKIMSDAKAKVAPLQEKLDELNKQIKSLESLPGVGGAPSTGPARAGFDLGGLTGKAGDKIATLKAEAEKYQKQIDEIMGQAKALGLPYTEQITGYTDQLKSVTNSLTTAQGLLGLAKDKLAQLNAPAQ